MIRTIHIARQAMLAFLFAAFIIGKLNNVLAQTFLPGNDSSGIINGFLQPGTQSLLVGSDGARQANMNGQGATFNGGVFLGLGAAGSTGRIDVNLANSNLTTTVPFPVFEIATHDATNGTVNVAGGSINTQFMQVAVGAGSNGVLAITDGDVFVTAPNDPLNVAPGLQIARDGAGSNGRVQVSAGFFAPITGHGRLNVTGQASVGRNGTGLLTVGQQGEAIIGGPITLAVSGSTSGNGTLNVTDSLSKVTAPVVLAGIELSGAAPTPGGTPYLGGLASTFSSPLGINPAGTGHGTGRVFVSNGGTLVSDVILGPGGLLNGSGGTVQGNVGNYGGTVAPGNSPGTLNIQGEYQQIGGTLEIEVASASDFDILNVTGNAKFTNATVNFSFINGFAPQQGLTFAFLNALSQSATNTTYIFSGLKPGFQFSVTPGTAGKLEFKALNDGVPVPEPTTLAMGLLGCAIAWAPRFRKRLSQRE